MRLARLLRNRMIGLARRVRVQVERVRPEQRPALDFATVRRRLELLLNAMYTEPLGDGLMAQSTFIQPTERSIVLPRSIPGDDAAETYRLLAIEQGARIVRGTRAFVPADPVERDLYMIIEGAAIDAAIAERAPGLSRAIARLRRAELARRGPLFVSRDAQPVDDMLRQLLSADPFEATPAIPRTARPEESATHARRMADDMRRTQKKRAHYTPIYPVGFWDHDSWTFGADRRELPGLTSLELPWAKSGKSDTPDPESHNESPNTEGTPTEERPDDASTAGDTEADTGSPNQGGSGSSDDDAGTAADGDATARNDDGAPITGPAPGGTQYPEWLDRFKRLEQRYTTVFDVAAPEGDGAWARDALREHAGLIRQLRDRFSLLRARRLRLRGQLSGEELDLDACVNALIDLKLKRSPSDRLYQTKRASRHSMAITILVDVSGSTREVLPDGNRVIDVERLSLILASEALASLGDPYSILAFTGTTRHDVRVAELKAFGENDLSAMHRRVSALEPGANTRLGAAVRHATSRLLAQPAQGRVLLILSDGRPHDVDWYWADGAIEDSRIAIREAHAAGVHSFCITVDSKEAEYLPHLFGEGRYWVLANPAGLPKALIRLIDTILTA